MNNEELKELMKLISQSNFVEFELEREGFKLKLVKDVARPKGQAEGNSGSPAPIVAPLQPAPLPLAPAPQGPIAAPAAAGAAEAFPADIVQVTSPMVGTFYRAPSPEAPPFVQMGDMIEKGQVLCIVEAMKLMNEIESEVSGEVVDIPVSTGQPVEYGEVLFRVRVTSP